MWDDSGKKILVQKIAAAGTLVLFTISAVCAMEIHVAKNGLDNNAGTIGSPYRTINKAAQMAQPGDVVIVHAGIYRESVFPARGGTSETNRIIYKAATDEDVIITGSERTTTWVSQGNNVWKVELPATFFGAYNPFALNISGNYLTGGQETHLGEVYLNGKAFYEKQTLDEVIGTENTWYTQTSNGTTKIWAKFGRANPNTENTEINVRECVFFPEITGLKYITIDGFTIRHAACNWAPPGILQKGAIGTRWGLSWIIQNCTITDAKNAGISIGAVPGAPSDDISSFGHHIIRNNVIQRCGSNAIVGDRGNIFSIIEGNLIEQTGYKHEFTGMEIAGIKFHYAIDVIIRNNCIRKQGAALVNGTMKAGYYGIHLDWSCQGVRITGNVFSITSDAAIFCEMDHGPQLIDNNVFLGTGPAFSNWSEGSIFVHNLFSTYPYNVSGKVETRSSPYYSPHTLTRAGSQGWQPKDDRWFNNIFVKAGLGPAFPQNPGYKADYNVYLDGAVKSMFDTNSLVVPFICSITDSSNDNEMVMSLNMNSSPTDVQCPLLTNNVVGKIPLVNQGMENPDGSPITISKDFFGASRNSVHPKAGPFEDAFTGRKSFVLFRRTNPVPIASISADRTIGSAPLNVSFTATGSSAPGGSIQSYVWDFGDGSIGTGSNVVHTFSGDSGRLDYPVTLQVTDSKGKTAQACTTIYIGRKPENPASTVPGLEFKAFTGTWSVLPDFQNVSPTQQGVYPRISGNAIGVFQNIGLVYEGYIRIVIDGLYRFSTTSDDGSQLYIGNTMVVDNNGIHASMQSRNGSIALNAGLHAICVKYFNGAVGIKYLNASWEGPGITMQSIPDSVLFRNGAGSSVFGRQTIKGNKTSVSLVGNNIVVVPGHPGVYLMDIIDAQGTVVYSHHYSGQKRFAVPIGNFSVGIYFVKVQTGKTIVASQSIDLSRKNR